MDESYDALIAGLVDEIISLYAPTCVHSNQKTVNIWIVFKNCNLDCVPNWLRREACTYFIYSNNPLFIHTSVNSEKNHELDDNQYVLKGNAIVYYPGSMKTIETTISYRYL